MDLTTVGYSNNTLPMIRIITLSSARLVTQVYVHNHNTCNICRFSAMLPAVTFAQK